MYGYVVIQYSTKHYNDCDGITEQVMCVSWMSHVNAPDFDSLFHGSISTLIID